MLPRILFPMYFGGQLKWFRQCGTIWCPIQGRVAATNEKNHPFQKVHRRARNGLSRRRPVSHWGAIIPSQCDVAIVMPTFTSCLRPKALSRRRSRSTPLRRQRRDPRPEEPGQSHLMNGTFCAIRPATKATSRDRRSSLATTTLHFALWPRERRRKLGPALQGIGAFAGFGLDELGND